MKTTTIYSEIRRFNKHMKALGSKYELRAPNAAQFAANVSALAERCRTKADLWKELEQWHRDGNLRLF